MADHESRARDYEASTAETPVSNSDKSMRLTEKSRWVMGMLQDKKTDEVPVNQHNAPLGLEKRPSLDSMTSASSLSRAMFSRRASYQSKKRTKDGKIILEPQPEESPNDPLNWSALRRDAALLSLGFYCMLGGGMTPILAAGFSNVADTYDVSVPRVALTTGLYMMGLGVGSVIASPTAIKFGKRPVYLVAALLFVLTSVWCALSPSYGSLVAARVFQGIAVSPVECLPSATIAEIYFLHERAYRLGIYTLLLLGGKNLVPLASAAVIESLGWRWVFWIVAIIVGFCFALLFFFVPETFWDRTPRPHRRKRPSSSELKRPSPARLHDSFPHSNPSTTEHEAIEDAEQQSPRQVPASIRYTNLHREKPEKTFVQTLRPYSGRLSHDNWFRLAFRPFILYAYPAILWSSAVYALSVGWLIVLSESVAEIYQSRETYNFTAIQTGLVYISPFVGGVLGTVVAGKISDLIVRFISRRNDGIYEPEFRLVMAIPVSMTTAIGLMGFGWSAEERDNFWVPTIFFGVISFGCTLGSTTAITFAVDSYRQFAEEALVTMNFSKNIFHGLVFSLFFNRWLESEGPKQVFICLGAIQVFFLLWTIPMYIFGKRARMWTVRKGMMDGF